MVVQHCQFVLQRFGYDGDKQILFHVCGRRQCGHQTCPFSSCYCKVKDEIETILNKVYTNEYSMLE